MISLATYSLRHKQHSASRRPGFTFLEALFVLIILSIIALISLGSYSNYKRRVNINSVVQELAGHVERARTLSLVQFKSSTYGLHFEAGQYVIFPGIVYNASDPDNEVVTLDNFIFVDPDVFDDGGGGTTDDVVFNALSGLTVNTGTIRLEASSNSTLFKFITINALGLVTIQ